MARASVPTALALDRFAKMMGIPPLMFNQSFTVTLPSGKRIFPTQLSQNLIWPQYSWQKFDQVSREELALKMNQVEAEIESVLGYSVCPKWFESVQYSLPSYHRPEYGFVDQNSAGNDPSIAIKDLFLSGGRRKLTAITPASVDYRDYDLDGFEEVVEVEVTLTGSPDIKAVKVYFPDHNGDQTWEIRPAKSRKLTGNVLKITFDSWMFFDPALWEAISTDEESDFVIDASDNDSYIADVEVYLEENDTSQVSAQFVSIDPNTGEETTEDGFIVSPDPSKNMVIPMPGTYDGSKWVRSSSILSANYVRLWYYAGIKPAPILVASEDDYLIGSLALSIAYMTTARLERPFGANSNSSALEDSLRMDWGITPDNMSVRPPQDAYTCPFGSKVGEVKAWKYIQHMLRKRPKAALI